MRDEIIQATPTPESIRLLFSYFYFAEEDIGDLITRYFPGIKVQVFADSGAYSAWTQGKPIDTAAYIAWVQRWQDWFDCAAAPDVIGDPAASHAAEQQMAAAGLRIPHLPVFHVGEPWSILQDMVQRSNYIALGGGGQIQRRRRVWEAWLAKAFSMIPPHVRVHGFAVTAWNLMRRHPWYSVDSTSWASCFLFGTLALFDQRTKRFVDIQMSDPKSRLGAASVLAQYGARPSDVVNKGYDAQLIARISLHSWLRAEAHLRQTRTYLGVQPSSKGSQASPQALGPAIFCGTGGPGAPNHPARLGPSIYTGVENRGGAGRRPAMLGPALYVGVGCAGAGAPNRPEQVGPAIYLGAQDGGSPGAPKKLGTALIGEQDEDPQDQ